MTRWALTDLCMELKTGLCRGQNYAAEAIFTRVMSPLADKAEATFNVLHVFLQSFNRYSDGDGEKIDRNCVHSERGLKVLCLFFKQYCHGGNN